MIITSKGYKKPVAGESGTPLFNAINFNTDRLNSHNHDGVNSEKLTAAAGAAVMQILEEPWVSTGAGGMFEKSVTMPAGLLFDSAVIAIRTDGGEALPLQISRQADTIFKVYANDNSLSLVAVYST